MHARGHPVGHRDPEPAQLLGLVGVVAEQGDPADPERAEHLGGDRVVPLVLAVAEGDVRLVGVEPVVLEHVGVELG